MSKEFAVVISPHIDDAVISLGETMRSYNRVLVLNVFNKSTETITGTAEQDVNSCRIGEDEKIARQYNFEFKYANLPDTSLRGVAWDNYRAPVDENLLFQAQEWVKSRLDEIGGDFRIFVPASYGLHPDHYLATLAFSSNPLLYYLNWVPFSVYCDQPYFLDKRMAKNRHGGHSFLKESGVLVAAPFSVAEKRAMLSAYKSQLSPKRIRFLAGKNKYEYYWITSPEFFTKSLWRK